MTCADDRTALAVMRGRCGDFVAMVEDGVAYNCDHTCLEAAKSDLRNHQAIVVQTRLYDCVMVTQITPKTEGPHGLPSGRRTEVDPLYPGLIIKITSSRLP
jgi:hypothetical protein